MPTLRYDEIGFFEDREKRVLPFQTFYLKFFGPFQFVNGSKEAITKQVSHRIFEWLEFLFGGRPFHFSLNVKEKENVVMWWFLGIFFIMWEIAHVTL